MFKIIRKSRLSQMDEQINQLNEKLRTSELSEANCRMDIIEYKEILENKDATVRALLSSNRAVTLKYDQLHGRMERSKETSTAMRGHLKDTIKDQDKTIKDLRMQVADLTDKLNRALGIPSEEAKPKRTYRKRIPRMDAKPTTRKSNTKK